MEKNKIKKILLILTMFPLIILGQCVSGDCTNGYGTYIYQNGDKYVGYSKDNKAHGFLHGPLEANIKVILEMVKNMEVELKLILVEIHT